MHLSNLHVTILTIYLPDPWIIRFLTTFLPDLWIIPNLVNSGY
jgi:hypothetical protein